MIALCFSGIEGVDDREEQPPLVFQPLLGLIILTFGAVSVVAGMVAVVMLITLFAVVGMPTKGFRSALLDVLHGFEMRGKHAIPVLLSVLLSVDAEDIRHLDPHRSSMIRLMASFAICSAF